MIEHLREIFSSLISYQDIKQDEKQNYHWFMTSNSELIGIHQKELTAKDLHLLTTFMRPHNMSVPETTPEEKAWYSYISNDLTQETGPVRYRFIYFSFQQEQMNPSLFKEAVNEFFAKQVPVLWENEHEGMIVEENPDEAISYETIIDVFMSDLSVKIQFFVGPFLTSLYDAKKGYHSIIKGAHIARQYTEKAVVTYVEAIPFILIEKTETDFKTDFVDTVLADTADDSELLKTVETFIACNLNVSVAAKELYLHRNSLQYRLDKFREKTGIDIREFHQAVPVYLALLAANDRNNNVHK